MARIMVYNDSGCVAITTKAYDCLVTKELMRAYFLQFTLVNNNPARKYIVPGVVFEIDGEMFDVSQFHRESGKENFTEVTAVHVSYRLNNYILPPGYSKLGTVTEIAQDILNTAVNSSGQPASSEFSLGTVKPTGAIAFTLGNEQEVTVRSAMLGLQAIGVEVDYSNFTINLPERVGTETGKVFRFGQDLVNLRRTWNVNDGSTYEIDVAALYRMPGGHPEDAFAVGDQVTIEDGYTGEAIQRRIIAYAKDPDNPLNDKLTLGVFIRDSITNAINMRTDINMKITEGENYNNVSINRTEGFVAESSDGQFKATMGGTEGFAAWAKESGVWEKKAWLDALGLIANAISAPGSNIEGRIGRHWDPYYLDWNDSFQLIDKETSDTLMAISVYDGNVTMSATVSSLDAFIETVFLGDGSGQTTLGFNHSAQLRLGTDYPYFMVNGQPYGRTENIIVSVPGGGTRTLTIKNGIIL